MQLYYYIYLCGVRFWEKIEKLKEKLYREIWLKMIQLTIMWSGVDKFFCQVCISKNERTYTIDEIFFVKKVNKVNNKLKENVQWCFINLNLRSFLRFQYVYNLAWLFFAYVQKEISDLVFAFLIFVRKLLLPILDRKINWNKACSIRPKATPSLEINFTIPHKLDYM